MDGLVNIFGKRDLEEQDFDLEDITGVLAKISSAWSKIVTGSAPVINGLPLGNLGKRDEPITSQDFDLEDITGVLAKISSAWSKIVTGSAPVINDLPLGNLGKRDAFGTAL